MKKSKITNLLNLAGVVLSFLAVMLIISPENKVEAAINNQAGDIIITNSTSSSGITGHAGIYIDATHILHTSGRKNEPYPTVITESGWNNRYSHSKVVRPSSSTLGAKAASMAKKYFQGKKTPFSIRDANKGPTNITNTYCSELVWYSYHMAGKDFKVPTSFYGVIIYVAPKALVTPYSYINSGAVKYNGFKFIDSTW